MRRFVALAAIVFAALTFAGSASPLIGGTPTGTAQHTNVGAFGVVLNGTFLEVCSGTVIEPNVVITAGHCTFFFEQLESRSTPLDVVFTLDPSPTAASPSYDAVDFFHAPGLRGRVARQLEMRALRRVHDGRRAGRTGNRKHSHASGARSTGLCRHPRPEESALHDRGVRHAGVRERADAHRARRWVRARPGRSRRSART